MKKLFILLFCALCFSAFGEDFVSFKGIPFGISPNDAVELLKTEEFEIVKNENLVTTLEGELFLDFKSKAGFSEPNPGQEKLLNFTLGFVNEKCFQVTAGSYAAPEFVGPYINLFLKEFGAIILDIQIKDGTAELEFITPNDNVMLLRMTPFPDGSGYAMVYTAFSRRYLELLRPILNLD